ncbi:MAG: hypothetical protein Q9166_007492 [cf. Caloplaca sp. 2 TL-2023]
MPLRIAQQRDLSTIAAIYAAAFWGERVVGELMHPHRQAHPQEYLRFWRQEVTEWYWNYSHQMIVFYTIGKTQQGVEEEILTGVADWVRHGEGWQRLWGVWGWWDPRSVINPLIAHFWSGARSTGWYLNFLAVHPKSQKQGYGTSLVQWGIERAKEENVAASVISGVGKDPFYRMCGFDVEVGKSTEGEGNPLKGKLDGGGTVFFRDPEH